MMYCNSTFICVIDFLENLSELHCLQYFSPLSSSFDVIYILRNIYTEKYSTFASKLSVNIYQKELSLGNHNKE